MVNSRPQCHAAVTTKRSMENYLHPAAIFEASGISEFARLDRVAGRASGLHLGVKRSGPAQRPPPPCRTQGNGPSQKNGAPAVCLLAEDVVVTGRSEVHHDVVGGVVIKRGPTENVAAAATPWPSLPPEPAWPPSASFARPSWQ